MDTGDCMWFYILSNAAMQCIGQTIKNNYRLSNKWIKTTVYLGTKLKIAEKYGGLRASDNEDDEDKKQKSKHVVHLMWPD